MAGSIGQTHTGSMRADTRVCEGGEMTIIVEKEIFCDRCLERWARVSARVEDDWPWLQKEGWTRGGGEHYCPDCSEEEEK